MKVESSELGVAIIAMTGRFPRARNLDEFWRNLRDGVEAISFFSDEDIIAAGVERDLLNRRNYVKARAILDDIEMFDAAFFGINAREAEMMDPQHRVFLECAWEALELAGYDSERYEGRIGVFAGVSMSTYFLFNLYSQPELMESVGALQTLIGNEKDYLPTRASYLLNLKGPSVNIQSACSTSLVAVHLASQSLLNGDCDIALAGGATIHVSQKKGYLYQAGGIMSPDGHCRAFDAKAQGTVGGNGVGIVALKRLEDALADGDNIRAVIKGSAINNDGSSKIGYTAPSVEGQAEVIAEALAMAAVEANTIGYVEAHGTGTTLGDPIEVAALTQAFRASTDEKNFCALGSVKSNIGHLDAAAGIAGLIKAVLAIEHKQVPPSLHFEQPNPQIDFANSPFYVSDKLSHWKANGTLRRAGVSAFGVGGTNAHVVLEEAPPLESDEQSRPWQLLTLSAKTASALDAATSLLMQRLTSHPQVKLADVAHTLQVGRRPFDHRRIVVCRDTDEAIALLGSADSNRVFTLFKEPEHRPVTFMFSGQGAQHVAMAAELYRVEPEFREQIEGCSDFLKPILGLDLRDVLYPEEKFFDEASERLKQTSITQPALFVIEYALAKLWMRCGIEPEAMIGHSLGEYVAACLAGVFSLEDALRLVAARGRLMQRLPGGAMLSVQLSQQEAQSLIERDERISLAAVNAPSLCVVSGPAQAIKELERSFTQQGVRCRLLETSHAFHSRMMEPALDEFAAETRKVRLNPPQIPFISNATGDWMTAADATEPLYWARHLRETVRFADGIAELLKESQRILLEIGPGQTLATLAKQQRADKSDKQAVLSTLPHPRERRSDYESFLSAVGQLWLARARVNWRGLRGDERRLRVALPTYPFERRRCWIEHRRAQSLDARTREAAPQAREQTISEVEQVNASITHSTINAAAPRNEIEQTVAGLWQELLGVERVGSNDDFFDLGGHSLLAIQLIAKVEEKFSVALSMNSLFEARTVAALASLIEEDRASQSERPSPLVAIERGGQRRPIFFAHASSGNVFRYAELARHLGPDQPFYALQASGLNDESEPRARIEDMAASYIEAVVSQHPRGPYLLGGWSMGGVIAFEMARQLQRRSLPVSLIMMIDTRVPSRAWLSGYDTAQMCDDFLSYLGHVFGKLIPPSYDELRRLSQDEQSGYVLERAAEAGIESLVGGPQKIRRQLDVYKANIKALMDYTPQKYCGRVVVLRAENAKDKSAFDDALGWSDLVSQPVETHLMPGDHYSILEEPAIRILAQRLKTILAEAEG